MREFELCYLQGLVTNRKLNKAVWADPRAIEDKTARMIMDILVQLYQAGSVMTPEIVKSRLAPVIGDDAAVKFVDSALLRKVTPAQVRELHGEITDKYVKHQAVMTLDYVKKNIGDENALDKAMFQLRSLKALQPSRTISIGAQSARALEEAFNAHHYIIPWPQATLRKYFLGLTRQEVHCWAGRPGTGKTTFAIFNALQWAMSGFKVLYFSKEMPAPKLIQKCLCMQNDDPVFTVNRMRIGNFDEQEKDLFIKASQSFVTVASENLLIFDDVYTVAEMETLIAKHRPDIVFDDFIQFTNFQGYDRISAIRDTMQTYKQVAKEYDLVFITLSQMNRNIEQREDHRPRLADLGESGAIETYSAEVMFLHYEHRYDEDANPEEVEIIGEKMRYGSPCGAMIRWIGDKCRYQDWQVGRQPEAHEIAEIVEDEDE